MGGADALAGLENVLAGLENVRRLPRGRGFPGGGDGEEKDEDFGEKKKKKKKQKDKERDEDAGGDEEESEFGEKKKKKKKKDKEKDEDGEKKEKKEKKEKNYVDDLKAKIDDKGVEKATSWWIKTLNKSALDYKVSGAPHQTARETLTYTVSPSPASSFLPPLGLPFLPLRGVRVWRVLCAGCPGLYLPGVFHPGSDGKVRGDRGDILTLRSSCPCWKLRKVKSR